MGNTKSFEQHSDFKDLQHNYTYEKKYNDSRFGEVKLLKENSTGQKIFQKDFSSNTPKEFEDYVNEIRDCSALSHPNVLKVFGYNSKKEDLFCADFYKLSLFFESFESDLEQEIAKRSHNKDYFPEKELWYILDSVASGCAYLQVNKIPHRDVRPYNVFITQSKDYKISPTNIFRQNYNPAYFENFDALEAKSRYYSPELLAHFSKPQAQRTPIDDYKSDVFSLGMTMLEAGLLQKVPDAYNYDKFEVRSPRIQEGLNQLRERYSENFVKTIESTLDFNPQTRLDFTRLDTELGRYRRDIREQARGANQTPTSPVVPLDQRGTHLRMASPERPVRSAAPLQYEDDLDRRVREAVKKSEEVIKRSSPTKYANKNLDPYIQSYLRNDLRPNQDQPLLSTISPYLTSESKYTTTLTIEQPNYGRESQPINFNQPQPGDPNIESFKRSAYADLASNIQPQTTLSPGGYTQPGGLGLQSAASFGQAQAQPQSYTNYGQTTTYDAVPRTYAQPESYLAGTNGLGNTGLGTYATSAPYGSTGLGQSGVNPNYSGTYGNTGLGLSGAGTNYAATNYGVPTGLSQTGGYGTPGGNTYAATTVDASNRNYVNEADDLSRRIAERLQQSKQLTS